MYIYNSWDPPDAGMGLLYIVCVCVCVYNSWDPPDTGMELYWCTQLMGSSGHRDGAVLVYTTHGILQTQGWGFMCVYVCVCVINNSWDPPDTGMGLHVCVCVCVCDQ